MSTPRNHFGGQILWMALLDAVCLVAGMVSGIILRLGVDGLREYLFANFYGWVYLGGSIILANYVVGSYGVEVRLSRFNMAVNWAFSILVGLLVVSLTSYAWLNVFLGRGVLLWAVAVYSVLWLALRLYIYQVLFRKPFFAYRVVVLGLGPCARELVGMIRNELLRPIHTVVALVDLTDGGLAAERDAAPALEGIPVVRVPAAEMAGAIRALDAHVVVIAFDTERQAVLGYPHLRRLRFEGVAVLSALNAAEIYAGRIPLSLVDEVWLMQASLGFATPVILRFKRILDVLLVMLAAPVLAPVGLIVAALIKLSAPLQPMLYSQQRVGRFGKTFRIYKFRTMIPRAEEAGGPMWSPRGDPRVTRLGRVLRRYRLDELPQTLNILRGDMSIVGPRPERPEIAAELEKQIVYYRERENVMPGLTGWAQIRHPYGSTVVDAGHKLEYDLFYVQNLSLGLDLRIVLRTLRIVLFGLERDMR